MVGQGDRGGLLIAVTIHPSHIVAERLANVISGQIGEAARSISLTQRVLAFDSQGVAHDYVVILRTTRQRAVQQLDAVEVGAVSDTVDFVLQLLHFLLQLRTVGLTLVSAVGGLGCQLCHTVEHVMHLSQSAFSGLHQRDTILSVFLSYTQTGNLGTHFLGNSQTSGVVTSAVDAVAGAQLLQVLAQCGVIIA